MSRHDSRNPTPDESEFPKWEPTQAFPLKYYRFGTKDYEGRPPLAMERGLLEERAAFWNKHKPHLAAAVAASEGKSEL